VIDHHLAEQISDIKESRGYFAEDFNACQITWSVKALKDTGPYSQFHPHEITLQYEQRDIIKLINTQDGSAESIQGLGLNCLEFNNHVYLFFDTIDYATRIKFNLSDLSYVIYSTDKGIHWSKLSSLHPFSTKAKFILPRGQFYKYVKIFGNTNHHVLSIFNLRDETTYLFDPDFHILKTVAVYNRLTDFEAPTDFHFFNNTLYLSRGSCELKKGRITCPSLSYLETSGDFGRTWRKETLPFMKNSYFLTLENNFYHFYHTPCSSSWLGLIPAIDRAYTCGNIKVKKLGADKEWKKPKILVKSASQFKGIFFTDGPILIWEDLRFHKNRPCGFIPVIGCVDSSPVRGPKVVFAGYFNMATEQITESIIHYQN